ncbi:MAG: hypothetical protein PHY62_06370 [Gallionella sp.]|nr:hypothetical protein [Gallionella sp.]
MKNLSISLLLLLVASYTSGLYAEDAPTKAAPLPKEYSAIFSTPIFSQVFVHGLPNGWQMVSSRKSPDGSDFVQVYALDGQNPSNWTELIMVTGMKDMVKTPNANLPNLIEYIAKQKRVVCPERFFAISAGSAMFGSRPGHTAILGCGRLSANAAGLKAGEGEIGVYIAVQGEKDFYVIQRVQRRAAFEVTPEPLSRSEFLKLVQSLMPIGVCEIGDSPDQCEPKLGGQK